MKKVMSLILNFILSHFKIQEKIVFETGRGLVDGNPKAVYDYLIKNYPNKFKLIWVVDKSTDVSSLRKGDYVFYHTLKAYYHQATAKYWIRSQSLGGLIKKRKEQVYIQLWHGNGFLKKMEYDVTNAKERPVLEHVKEWDYYVTSNKKDANIIRSATGYDKKIMLLGMACCDTTLKLSNNKGFRKKILKELGINDFSKKIILYAPTFRDYDLEKAKIEIPISCLKKMGKYIVLVRLHPLVRKKIPENFFGENLINACEYPDISNLLAIADILITDYSSVYYQFCPLNRPIIFYAYDLEKYEKLRGGFYLNYRKELPGPICYNEKELKQTMEQCYSKKYKEKLLEFNKKYSYLNDGRASERIVEKLINGEFK